VALEVTLGTVRMPSPRAQVPPHCTKSENQPVYQSSLELLQGIALTRSPFRQWRFSVYTHTTDRRSLTGHIMLRTLPSIRIAYSTAASLPPTATNHVTS